MATTKKTTTKKTESKPIENAAPAEIKEKEVKSVETKPSKTLYQFISKNLSVTGSNNLKLINVPVTVFEVYTESGSDAFNKFIADVQKNFNVEAEKAQMILHDIFGGEMIVRTIKGDITSYTKVKPNVK